MFWNAFYKLCEKNSIKPNAVAKIIGVSSATCTKWKNGTIPNGDTLLKLADYFKVTTDYLLGRTEESTPIFSNVDNNNSDNQAMQSNVTLSQTNETENNELLEMIKSLSLLERSKVVIFIDELRKKES